MTKPSTKMKTLMTPRARRAEEPREKIKFTLVIPEIPLLRNRLEGKHWWAKHKERDRWRILVGCHVLALPIHQRPLQPFERANLRLVRHTPRACDPLAVAESFKYVVDALIEARVLVDDSHEHVQFEPQPRWQKCPGKHQHITVEVTEL